MRSLAPGEGAILNGSVFVTGATGFIGQRLVQALIDEGANVCVLTSKKSGFPSSWAGRVDVREGDLADERSLSQQLIGCVVVYHLAGELGDPKRMTATNVEGTTNLLAACETANIGHVVHLSSVGVIGARAGGRVDETSPCKPQGAYEQSKWAAEQEALAWRTRTAIPLAILRPTIVFGGGARAATGPDSMLAWLRAIQSGRFVFFCRKAVANYIYVGDVVEACRLASNTRADGTFVIADSCPLADFVAAAARAMGCHVPRWRVPKSIGLGLAVMTHSLARLVRKQSPLTVARVQALSSQVFFDATRFRASTGWRPGIGWEAGLGLTVRWYRENGLLS
jgi:nucleoside-diphosphate-sugar epimerase